jgi:glycerophosphoryl diester phosphodiesterase
LNAQGASSVTATRCWAIAHRGTPRRHRENTIAGFHQALELGCDGIELDVQLSADGVPVVYHDRTLARAGGGWRRIHQLRLSELKRLDYKLPLLSDVLEQFAGRTRLLIEIKTREGADASPRHRQLATLVAAQAQDAPAVWVLSFDSDVLRTVARVAPDLPRVLNVRPLFPGLAAKLRNAAPAVVDADVRGLSVSFGRRIRRDSRELWSFTCNTAAQVRTARQAGASAIISDRVDWLIECLERET